MELADLVYIDDTGYHYADYPSFLAWRQQQYRDIYGADLYLEADSQDGQLVAVQAKSDYDTAAGGAAIYNSFSPATAQGLGLARVVKINGLTKQVPSYSTVTLTIVGTAATVITDGVAQDTLGQKWNLPATVTIPGGGTVDVTGTADTVGAVNASANTVTTIFTPTRGWQTVNNAGAATPGAAVESDAALRVRQAESTANPSLTVFEGTVGAVLNVSGVTKAQGYENDTGSTDSHSIPAHTICVVTVGGAAADIAQAIQVHKTPGTGTYGSTSTTVYDSHGMPLVIKFQAATTATIGVTVNLVAGVGWSTDFITLMEDVIAAAVNALNIGSVVYYTALFGPSYLGGTAAAGTFSVTSITIGKNGGARSAANITLNFDENPVCTASVDVTVNVS
jgi:uncharacterized phage protein gp47/JayE